MFIKLTNANASFVGQPVLIKSELIVSVYSGLIEQEDGSFEQITYVFCPPHGEWQVKESADAIMSMLNPESVL
jgi:hypothetical protein